MTDIIFREVGLFNIVEEDSLITLKKNIELIRELENIYRTIEQESSRLHIRFASIITENPLYELSISFNLLDDLMKEELDPYFVDYYLSKSDQEVPEASDTYYGKVIEASNLETVMKILGLEEITDSTYKRDLFNKLYELYVNSFDIMNSLFRQANIDTEYFGERYFPKLIDSTYAYALDTYEFYMMDYTHDSIPLIFKLLQNDIIREAIEYLCIPASDLDFYSSS